MEKLNYFHLKVYWHFLGRIFTTQCPSSPIPVESRGRSWWEVFWAGTGIQSTQVAQPKGWHATTGVPEDNTAVICNVKPPRPRQYPSSTAYLLPPHMRCKPRKTWARFSLNLTANCQEHSVIKPGDTTHFYCKVNFQSIPTKGEQLICTQPS